MKLIFRALIFMLTSTQICAHEVRPGFLRITETADGGYEILWKFPVVGNISTPLIPHLSSGWLSKAPVTQQATNQYVINRWIIKKNQANINPLDGQNLTIEGLKNTITSVIIYIHLKNGKKIQTVLTPENLSLEIRANKSYSSKVIHYFPLGVKHILAGVDHLMFILGLVLLVNNRSQLVKTVTAFTLSHSITLTATTLDMISINAELMETLIALSITFVALEVAHATQGKASVTARFPWIVAFIFGLLHGFAFADILENAGLPSEGILLPLLFFNIGVEAGQLLFVAVLLSTIWLLKALPQPLPTWSRPIPSYTIGIVSMVWFFHQFRLLIE